MPLLKAWAQTRNVAFDRNIDVAPMSNAKDDEMLAFRPDERALSMLHLHWNAYSLSDKGFSYARRTHGVVASREVSHASPTR